MALAALLGGLPYALLRFGHLPTSGPAFTQLLASFTSIDDGSVLLTVLSLVGWIAWAVFALSTVLELAALLAGVRIRRLPMLGGSRRLASTLLGALILFGSPVAQAANPAQAATASALPQAGTGAARTHQTPAVPAAATVGPAHTVAGTETLWDIAEQHLGAGQRWKEIAQANEGAVMADGQVFDAGQALQPGWVLALPTTATSATATTPAALPTPPHAPSAAPAATPGAGGMLGADHVDVTAATVPVPPAAAQVTVRQGDSLWSIAKARLGDPARYPQIAHLNHLKNPNLILPGWILKLPHAKPPAAQAPHRQTRPTAPVPHQTAPAPSHTPGPAASRPHASSPAQQGAGGLTTHSPAPTTSRPADPRIPAATPAPSQHHAAPTTPAPHTTGHAGAGLAPHSPAATPGSASRPPADPRQPAESASPATPAPSAAGRAQVKAHSDTRVVEAAAAGGVLAASVLLLLGSRRLVQQRRRRHKQRIPMPDGPLGDFEQQMRVAEQPLMEVELVDRALRTLAAHLKQAGRPLPEIAAAVLSAHGVELRLAEPAPPLPPFRAVDGDLGHWLCPPRSTEILAAAEARELPAPYPALVSIGHTEDTGDPVLVDLEALGILQLDGDQDQVHEVLLALAVELAASQLTDGIGVVVTGTGSELQEPFAHLTHYATSAPAIAELAVHASFQRDALAASPHASLREARLEAVGADAFTPTVLLSGAALGSTDAAQLAAMVSEQPRSAVAVVASADPALQVAGTWILPAEPDAAFDLPGLDIPVVLQRLEPDAYAKLLALLETAARTDDVPAPSWAQPESARPAAPQPFPHGSAEAGNGGIDPIPVGDLDTRNAPSASQGEDDDSFAVSPPAAPTLPDAADAEAAASPGAVSQQPDEAEPEGPIGRAAHLSLAHNSPVPQADQDAARHILTALQQPVPDSPHPTVLLLGPVEVAGARGTVEPGRTRALTETAAWMVLNPGLTFQAMDEAVSPGRRVTAGTRNTTISKLRRWLGTTEATDDQPAQPYLPPITGGAYALGPLVSCDWMLFQELYQQGMHRSGEAEDLALARALALVRGRPFAGIDPARYAWAEPVIQEMVSSVLDVAHELAVRRLEAGDYRTAAAAATKGLGALPDAELLFQDLFRIHAASGDSEGLHRAMLRLNAINEQLGVDPQEETVELLEELLHGRRRASA
ncbi:hypothetical protein BIV57_13355 [Mangrovactinospora gilvigrisea]|uniref:LysM domain-containing protein n=1 Tax=Mangrovactinospora gilvigrisea TaxID=1428644 RepID=A0A1J7BE62_9ACTN|nr:hypothetical protein BIV57_13355 [Mangrovactinospora gilvigrisea]